jgi:hypothetical protein
MATLKIKDDLFRQWLLKDGLLLWRALGHPISGKSGHSEDFVRALSLTRTKIRRALNRGEKYAVVNRIFIQNWLKRQEKPDRWVGFLVLLMLFYLKWNSKDICHILQISPATLRFRALRGLKYLKFGFEDSPRPLSRDCVRFDLYYTDLVLENIWHDPIHFVTHESLLAHKNSCERCSRLDLDIKETLHLLDSSSIKAPCSDEDFQSFLEESSHSNKAPKFEWFDVLPWFVKTPIQVALLTFVVMASLSVPYFGDLFPNFKLLEQMDRLSDVVSRIGIFSNQEDSPVLLADQELSGQEFSRKGSSDVVSQAELNESNELKVVVEKSSESDLFSAQEASLHESNPIVKVAEREVVKASDLHLLGSLNFFELTNEIGAQKQVAANEVAMNAEDKSTTKNIPNIPPSMPNMPKKEEIQHLDVVSSRAADRTEVKNQNAPHPTTTVGDDALEDPSSIGVAEKVFFRWGAFSKDLISDNAKILEILKKYQAEPAGEIPLGGEYLGGRYYHFTISRDEFQGLLSEIRKNDTIISFTNSRATSSRFTPAKKRRIVFLIKPQ